MYIMKFAWAGYRSALDRKHAIKLTLCENTGAHKEPTRSQRTHAETVVKKTTWAKKAEWSANLLPSSNPKKTQAPTNSDDADVGRHGKGHYRRDDTK